MANIRVDQTWGSAQIMGAIHDASGAYYGTTTNTGNPANALGWAAGTGVKINTPSIGAGDYLQAEVNYSQGASGYVNNGGVFYNKFNGGGGGTMGFGLMSDSVYGGLGATATSIQLTTSWGVNAAFEHHWNPHWQTSVYGAYVATNYNSLANDMLCVTETGGVGIFGSLCGCWCHWLQQQLVAVERWYPDAMEHRRPDLYRCGRYVPDLQNGYLRHTA